MKRVARAKKIIELAVPVDAPPAFLDNIDELAPLNDVIFYIGLVSKPEDTPEEPKPLDENELADIRVVNVFLHCSLHRPFCQLWLVPCSTSSVQRVCASESHV